MDNPTEAEWAALAVNAIANTEAALKLAQQRTADVAALLAEVERLRAQVAAAELLRAAAAQVLAALPTSPDFHARLVALASAKRAMERGEGAELHKALLMAARAVAGEHAARAAFKAALYHDAPALSLRAASDAHDAAERLIDTAAEALRAAGFNPLPPASTPATE